MNWWLMRWTKRHGISKASKVHALGTMNVCVVHLLEVVTRRTFMATAQKISTLGKVQFKETAIRFELVLNKHTHKFQFSSIRHVPSCLWNLKRGFGGKSQ